MSVYWENNLRTALQIRVMHSPNDNNRIYPHSLLFLIRRPAARVHHWSSCIVQEFSEFDVTCESILYALNVSSSFKYRKFRIIIQKIKEKENQGKVLIVV